MSDTEQHQHLLAVFHYIVGGLSVLFSCLPLIHVGIGVAVYTGQMPPDQAGHLPPDWFGLLFIAIGAVVFLVGQTLSVLIIYSGVQLKKRQKRLFSLVMACLLCMIFPFGTVLGVLTILHLNKDSVKALYT